MCEKYGYAATACYYTFDKNFGSQNNPNQNAEAAAFFASPKLDQNWYFDNGATNHVTNDLTNLSAKEEHKGHEKLAVGDRNTLMITHTGKALLNTLNPKHKLLLRNILHVPKIKKNLLSISSLLSNNDITIEFSNGKCCVKDNRQVTLLLDRVLKHGMFQFSSPTAQTAKSFISSPSLISFHNVKSSPYESFSSVFNVSLSNPNVGVLHRRLGHPNSNVLNHIISSCSKRFGRNKNLISSFCDACQLGKSHRQNFKSTCSLFSKPLKLIHTDLWGRSPILSYEGYKYYIFFMDDHTKFTWLYPLKENQKLLKLSKFLNTS